MQKLDDAMQRVMSKYETKFVEYHKDVFVFQLANGMKVILRQDQTVQSVVINRVVAVGSCNEPEGFAGGAHFFEHLNFACDCGDCAVSQGTGFDEVDYIVGGNSNATTATCGTAYSTKVGKEFLELALATDAQRVRGLKLTEKARQSEMRVILNEMEQSQDNPGEVLYGEMFRRVFKKHPMRQDAIGTRKDVSNMTVEQLQWFYDQFYWPDNMTLIVAGNVEPVQALELINRHYGAIPSSPKPIPVVDVIEPKQKAERRFVVRNVGALTYVMVGFRIPAAEHQDISRLWVLEDILGASSGRLRKVLVDTNKAADIAASVDLGRDYGVFYITAIVAEGGSADDVIAVILSELEKLASEPVAEAELETFKKKAKRYDQRVWADIETWAVSYIGKTLEYADWKVAADSLDKFLAVTPEQIQDAAALYFQKANRTVGRYVPTKRKVQKAAAADTQNSLDAPAKQTPERPAVEITPEQKFDNLMALVKRYGDPQSILATTLADKVVTANLDNGIFLATLAQPAHGLVTLNVRIRRAGDAYAGLASKQIPAFVSELLVTGTTEFSKNEIRRKLACLGTNLDVSCGELHVDIAASLATEDLPELMQLLKALLRNPTFPEEELDIIKVQMESNLQVIRDNAESMAHRGLLSALYTSESVFHPPSLPQMASELTTIQLSDLKAFHKSHYLPQQMSVAFVGDISAEKAYELLQVNFGDWQGDEIADSESPLVVAEPFHADNNSVEYDMPGKENTHVVFGRVIELSRQSKDYFAGLLSNAYLGGDTISGLLGKSIRGSGQESQASDGITYGIRSSFEGLALGQPTWLIEADVNPAYVDDLHERVCQVLARYKEVGIKPYELARLKMSQAASYMQSLDEPYFIASKLSALGPRFAELDSELQQIEAVTVEQIHEFNQKNIDPDQLTLSIAGDLDVEQEFA